MRIILTNSVGHAGIGATAQALQQGRLVLDAIEEGIQCVELDPTIHSVGRGGWPNLLGEVELDASIMCGRSLRAGAVGALKGYLHPITVARRVMECLPHVFLVGEGAERFAGEQGMLAGENLTPEAREGWERWLARHDGEANVSGASLSALARRSADPVETKGTTVFLATDANGDMACGVSTSGYAWKYPGRLGDSPVIGAGNYADNRYGVAACTGYGELTIRAGTARAVVLYMKMGMGVREACHEAAADLRALTHDYAGSVTIYAFDRHGVHHVLACGAHAAADYCLWTDGMAEPETRSAEATSLY